MLRKIHICKIFSDTIWMLMYLSVLKSVNLKVLITFIIFNTCPPCACISGMQRWQGVWRRPGKWSKTPATKELEFLIPLFPGGQRDKHKDPWWAMMIMMMMFIPVEQHDKLKDPWRLELFLVGLRRLGRDPEMFDNCASSWNYQIDHSIIFMIMMIMVCCWR